VGDKNLKNLRTQFLLIDFLLYENALFWYFYKKEKVGVTLLLMNEARKSVSLAASAWARK